VDPVTARKPGRPANRRLQFTLEMPAGTEFATASAIQRLAAALEDAGFWGAGYTDHPAPSRRWLDSGGHATLDPFAALSFLAAVTARLRLMTYLAVLPYRNPFLTARCVATVDRLSGGRFTLVAGCGYLKSEFAALGCQFARCGPPASSPTRAATSARAARSWTRRRCSFRIRRSGSAAAVAGRGSGPRRWGMAGRP
jgi:alkanesulfonate monooxygenase SsuD/methylene tetrahydromethanopterin reductase-like flavin-dependent oxidoreductase (luciferase family)